MLRLTRIIRTEARTPLNKSMRDKQKPKKEKGESISGWFFKNSKTFGVSIDKGVGIIGSCLVLMWGLSELEKQKIKDKYVRTTGNSINIEERMGKEFKAIEIEQFSLEEMIARGEAKADPKESSYENIRMRRAGEPGEANFQEYLSYARGLESNHRYTEEGGKYQVMEREEYEEMMAKARGGKKAEEKSS